MLVNGPASYKIKDNYGSSGSIKVSLPNALVHRMEGM